MELTFRINAKQTKETIAYFLRSNKFDAIVAKHVALEMQSLSTMIVMKDGLLAVKFFLRGDDTDNIKKEKTIPLDYETFELHDREEDELMLMHKAALKLSSLIKDALDEERASN